jgi:hypothetical protein
MPTVASQGRAFILIAAAFVLVRGDSIALPLAHLFADHHHQILFSAASGIWEWAEVADHDGLTATIDSHGHDHEIGETAAPLRVRSVSGSSPALTPIGILDSGGDLRSAPFRAVLDLAPDIGKPDLARLAMLRV